MDSKARNNGPVAVVGAGITGTSWAAAFAAHGLEVRLCDRRPERLSAAARKVRSYVAFLVRHRLVAADLAEYGLEQFSCPTSLSKAVDGTTFVQEAVSENYEDKRAVFAEVDAHAPASTLISTSSSGLSIGEIQKACSLPGRCLAGHPYNPPHIVPLVEIAPGEQTIPEGAEAALDRGLPYLTEIDELMQRRDESLARVLAALKVDSDSAPPTTRGEEKL